ncbi:hypothetical protein GH714_014060 [Hevea brasiliensis]|uniref:Uncharacterized protein n=1 Tax=Hevea brasiliensis TaxID=3981 RepID=A0A6A6LEL8_HEVBR|nr:hypothetical protein GH714_014060 [Hevea brasiliensis]
MPNHLSGAEPFQVARSSSQSLEKETEDQQTNKVPQSCVTLIYKANVAESSRYVTVTWNKNLINYSLTIGVENPSNEDPYTCKIDLKTWQFWGRKGIKSFQVDGKRVEVYWDFRHAKFSSNPEPSSDYYVALVYDEEVVLILGDLKKDAYKRTKKRPSLIEPILLCKKENVYGKKIFLAKQCYTMRRKSTTLSLKCHQGLVILSCGLASTASSSASPGAGNGLFIFKPGFPNSDTNREEDAGNGLRYDSPLERTPTSGFFHVIYAWKIE